MSACFTWTKTPCFTWFLLFWYHDLKSWMLFVSEFESRIANSLWNKRGSFKYLVALGTLREALWSLFLFLFLSLPPSSAPLCYPLLSFISVTLSLFPSRPRPCISSHRTTPRHILISSPPHFPPLPSPEFLLLSLFSLAHLRLGPSCLMRKGGRVELIRLEQKVQSGAEQSLVSSRQAVRNQNGSALQTRSLAVDFQGGFCASDFCERPRSSQRQPCGNSSGRSKPQPPQTQFSDGHRMSNMEGEDEVLSPGLWTI